MNFKNTDATQYGREKQGEHNSQGFQQFNFLYGLNN